MKRRFITTEQVENVIDQYKARAKGRYLAAEEFERRANLLEGDDKETRKKRDLLRLSAYAQRKQAKIYEYNANVKYPNKLAALRIVLQPYTAP
jgi:hypothetical protein